MPVNISSNGDVNVKGNIKGRVYITGDFTVEGTYDCRHNMENHKSYANSFSLKNYIGEGDYYIETGSGVDIDNNAKGDIYFDSTDNYDSIVIGGNFKGNIIDIRKETADDDGSVDIEVKGYAEGNIQNNSEGDIKIGFGDD